MIASASAAAAVVTGLFIWLRIDDQRQRSFVTAYWDRPPGSQEHKDIRGRMCADRRECMPGGGQTLLPWRISRSVIASAGPAGVNGQVAVPAGGQLKVPTPRVDDFLFRVIPPRARACRGDHVP